MERAPAQYPSALLAGIAATCLICLWGSFEYYRTESAYQQQTRDPFLISAQITRLEPLRAAVPENAELGYLTDAQPGSVLESTLLLGTQYALAPRLVIKDAAHQRVLGNFTRATDVAAFGKSHGLRVEKDFGDGIVLFRKER